MQPRRLSPRTLSSLSSAFTIKLRDSHMPSDFWSTCETPGTGRRSGLNIFHYPTDGEKGLCFLIGRNVDHEEGSQKRGTGVHTIGTQRIVLVLCECYVIGSIERYGVTIHVKRSLFCVRSLKSRSAKSSAVLNYVTLQVRSRTPTPAWQQMATCNFKRWQRAGSLLAAVVGFDFRWPLGESKSTTERER